LLVKVALFSRYPCDSEHPKGGVESVTVVLAKALAHMDDLEVHVVTFERQRAKVTIEQDGPITVHRLRGARWPQICDVMVGPGKRRLIHYIENMKPDILHTHEVWGLGLGGIRVPHVFTIHGFDYANLVADSATFGRTRSRLWKLAIRRGLLTQEHIISITPYVRRVIEPLTNAHIYDIDNPVDDRFFQIDRHAEPGRILTVGWINERKNTLGSVDAFARVAGYYPHARLVIAGQAKEPKYLHHVEQSIKKHAIADRIEMVGHVNHAQLVQELAKASVFLLPSRQENAPMAIAEAMAAGIPVVAASRCGMPYMVEEDRTGFLIDPESTEQIAYRLDQLLASPKLRQHMGEAGHGVALERFHPKVVAEKTKAVYERICGTISIEQNGTILTMRST
jgi:glycosyltransferase involved in cell wall biosynthesis